MASLIQESPNPINFRLLNQQGQGVLYTRLSTQSLDLEIENRARGNLALAVAADSDPGPGNSQRRAWCESSFAFYLKFRNGTLWAPQTLAVATADWLLIQDVDGPKDADCYYLLRKNALMLAPGEKCVVQLTGIAADGRGGSRSTQVECRYQVRLAGTVAPLTGTRLNYLAIMDEQPSQDPGNAPIRIDIVGSNQVLNDSNWTNHLTVRLRSQTKDRKLALSAESKITLRMLTGDADSWALMTTGDLGGFACTAPGWRMTSGGAAVAGPEYVVELKYDPGQQGQTKTALEKAQLEINSQLTAAKLKYDKLAYKVNLGRMWHTIRAKGTGKYLRVKDGSKDQNASVVQYGEFPIGPNGLWYFKPLDSEQIWQIVSQHSWKALKIDGNSSGNGARAVQSDAEVGADGNGKWRLVPTGEPRCYKIICENSHGRLYVFGNNKDDNTEIQQYSSEPGSDNNGYWYIEPASDDYGPWLNDVLAARDQAAIQIADLNAQLAQNTASMAALNEAAGGGYIDVDVSFRCSAPTGTAHLTVAYSAIGGLSDTARLAVVKTPLALPAGQTNSQARNVALGSAWPDRAGAALAVSAPGRTVARFGAAGVSLMQDSPQAGLNAYFRDGWRSMSGGGFGAAVSLDTNLGICSLQVSQGRATLPDGELDLAPVLSADAAGAQVWGKRLTVGASVPGRVTDSCVLSASSQTLQIFGGGTDPGKLRIDLIAPGGASTSGPLTVSSGPLTVSAGTLQVFPGNNSNVVARFGDMGVTLHHNKANVGMNAYYDNGWKSMAAGPCSVIGADGLGLVIRVASAAAVSANQPLQLLDVLRVTPGGISVNGVDVTANDLAILHKLANNQLRFVLKNVKTGYLIDNYKGKENDGDGARTIQFRSLQNKDDNTIMTMELA